MVWQLKILFVLLDQFISWPGNKSILIYLSQWWWLLKTGFQWKDVDAPAFHSPRMTEIKAVYSAQHKHSGIDIIMSTAGFWLAPQQEHLSCPEAQITKEPSGSMCPSF